MYPPVESVLTCQQWPNFERRDLHLFRGHEQTKTTGFVMGHEFTGIVVVAGEDVKTVQVGDKIVAPFTVSW